MSCQDVPMGLPYSHAMLESRSVRSWQEAPVGRREKTLDRNGEAATELALELRMLRHAADLTYRQLSSCTRFSTSTLQDALAGHRMPTIQVTLAIVAACGGDTAVWQQYWHDLRITPAGQASTISPPSITATRASSLSRLSHPDDTQPGDSSQQVPGADGNACLQGANAPSSRGGDIPELPGADILLQMWQEQRTQARQSENQRAVFTAITVTLAVVAFTVVEPRRTEPAMLWLTVPIALLGAFGALSSLKYYERHQMHMTEAQGLRRQISELMPHLFLEDNWASSRAAHSQRYRLLYRVRVHHLWAAIHLIVAITGIVVSIIIAL